MNEILSKLIDFKSIQGLFFPSRFKKLINYRTLIDVVEDDSDTKLFKSIYDQEVFSYITGLKGRKSLVNKFKYLYYKYNAVATADEISEIMHFYSVNGEHYSLNEEVYRNTRNVFIALVVIILALLIWSVKIYVQNPSIIVMVISSILMILLFVLINNTFKSFFIVRRIRKYIQD